MHHFGVLIPSTNTTVEIEYSRLLPASLQVHVGRLLSSGTGPFAPSKDDDIDYQAKLLGSQGRGDQPGANLGQCVRR